MKKSLINQYVHIIMFRSLIEGTEQDILMLMKNNNELEYKHPTHTSDVISLHQCTNTTHYMHVKMKTDHHNDVLCYCFW